MNLRSEPVTLSFPERGVDQSEPFATQPEGTCPDLRNVRTRDSRDRQGGGKRTGFVRAVSQAAGSGLSSQRVTGLTLMSQARAAPAGAGGNITVISQPFTGLTVATEVDLSVVTSGTDLVSFNHSAMSAANTQFFSGVNGVASAISGNCMAIDGIFSGTAGNQFPRGVAINYFTTNDITVTVETIKAIAYLDVVAADRARWGPINEPCGVGPFIRGAITLNQMVMARLLPTAANKFKLQIINVGSTTPPAQLAISAEQTLGVTTGAATQYTLRLVENSSGIQAILNWADESISNLTVTAAGDTTYSGNYRAGVIVCTDTSPGGVNTTATVVTSYRKIKQIDYAKRVPSSYQVYKTVDASDTAFTANFTLPALFRAFSNNEAGVVSNITDGPATYAAAQNWLTVDSTNDYITGNTGTGHYVLADLDPATGSGPADTRPGVDILPIPNFRSDTMQMRGGAAFRISDDSKTYISIDGDFSSTPSNASGATASSTINTGVMGYRLNNIQVDTYVAGVQTSIFGPNLSTHVLPMRETDRLRFTDDGTVIRIYLNGMNVFSYTPPSYPGTGFRCGYASRRPTTIPRIKAARIVQGETSAGVDLSEIDPKILVVTQGRFQIADLINDTLSSCTGVGSFLGALPQAATLNNKFYCVDGTSAGGIGGGIIVDPVALTTTDWAATIGTAPWDDATIGPARLVAVYRGRVVLARFQNNATLWCMTRVAAPTDFSYGATPTQTAAVIGSNAKIGSPADAITALIPISDDYMLFMCTSSVWMLEGDPGYGGKIQNLTQQGGCFGPRAWCISTDGTLYWLGAGGLFRMPRGSRVPEPVATGRLAAYLERADSGLELCQMAFDHLMGLVHVFLTPSNGTSTGVHVVYEPARDALWLDSYPLTFGPWAVCQLAGASDDYRRFLIGGNDGYLRRPSSDATGDDGTAISSYVRFAPFETADSLSENLLTELQFQLGSSSGAITYEVLTAKTPADLAALAVGSGTVTGSIGGNGASFVTPIRLRSRAGSHQLVLSQSSSTLSWQFENAVGMFAQAGRRR